jgi:hypothetical protein
LEIDIYWKGAKGDIPNKEGRTPLWYATVCHDKGKLYYLMDIYDKHDNLIRHEVLSFLGNLFTGSPWKAGNFNLKAGTTHILLTRFTRNPGFSTA